jgi:hypothetical protein
VAGLRAPGAFGLPAAFRRGRRGIRQLAERTRLIKAKADPRSRNGPNARARRLLACDRMQDFQELADEAFRDLLQKHGRPTDLKTALRQSAGVDAVAEKLPKKTKGRAKW